METTAPLDPLLEILPTLPALLRRHGWERVVSAVAHEGSDAIARFDRALASWPAARRNAYPSWYCRLEHVGEGPWTVGHDAFRGLVEPTVPVFRLARQIVLDAPEGVDEGTLAELAAWPSLATLESVVLDARGRPGFGDAIAAFARDPRAMHLREYDLALGRLPLEAIVRILEALPPGLERLAVHGVADPGFAEWLARWAPSRPHLSGLHLFGCRLGAAGLRTLVEAGALDPLVELSLYEIGLDDEAAEAWAARPSGRRLRCLELGERDPACGSRMQDRGLVALAEAGWLDGLVDLSVSHHLLAGPVLRSVLERADLSELRGALLHAQPIGEEDVVLLRDSRHRLPALEYLLLSETSLGPERERWVNDAVLSPRLRILFS